MKRMCMRFILEGYRLQVGGFSPDMMDRERLSGLKPPTYGGT